MATTTRCPKCGSADLMFSKKKQAYICEDCAFEFGDGQVRFKRIYLSYGFDEHSSLALRLKRDLEARGHHVWYDPEQIKADPGSLKYVNEGMAWASEHPGEGRFITLLTPASVRRPDGYSLNEIARAVQLKLPVLPVMVSWCQPPLSICRIQWLDMRDCVPDGQKQEQYSYRLQQIIDTIEQEQQGFPGAQTRLLRLLEPLPFDIDIQKHLARFTGRQWIFRRVDAWLADPAAPSIFWIIGAPGVGKTAIASWLAFNRSEVAAFHLCRYGDAQKSDPRRAIMSIAYQLSTQLPDYQERLNNMNLDKLVRESDARMLFDYLLVQPLSGDFPEPGRIIAILIDALDEAARGGRNELAEIIAAGFSRVPKWLRLIITSRPEPDVLQTLQGLTPYMLDTSAPENDQDIKEYLARELRPFAPEKDLPEAVVDRIAAMSEGIFLYVEWIRQELAQKRLFLDRLNEFPQGLTGVYTQFFVRQYPEAEGYRKRISKALEIIVSAYEPLKMEFIAAIFHWDEYDQADFSRELGALFPIADGKVQPFHKSIIDWLTSADRAAGYYVDARNGHMRLCSFGCQEYRGGIGGMSDYMIAHLPAHLIQMKYWNKARTVLTDLSFFEAAWKLNEYDVKAYWSRIEKATDLRIPEAYRHIIDNPGLHGGRSWGVASLLFDTGNYDNALILYDHLIDYYRKTGDKQRLADSLGKNGRILVYRGNPGKALEVHREEEMICRQLNDTYSLSKCLGSQATAHFYADNLAGMIKVAEEMEKYSGPQNKMELSKVFRTKGHILQRLGKMEESMEAYGKAEKLCREIKDLTGLLGALNQRAGIYFSRGDLGQALNLCKECEQLSREHGDRFALYFALSNQSEINYDLGNIDEAIRLLKEAGTICRLLDHKDGIQANTGNLAVILNDTGEPDAALKLHTEEIALCRELNNKTGLHIALGNMAIIYHDRGQLDGAMALLREKEQIARESSNIFGIQQALGNQGLIAYDRGDLDEALRLHKDEESMCREMGNKKDLNISLYNQANIFFARGEPDGAMKRYCDAERAFRELDYFLGIQACLNGKAMILRSRGQPDEALALLKESEDICRKISYIKGIEASIGNQAVILHAKGQIDEALRLLKEAEATFRNINFREGLAVSLVNQAIVLAFDKQSPATAIPLSQEACQIVDLCGFKALSREICSVARSVQIGPACLPLAIADGGTHLAANLLPFIVKMFKQEKK